MEKGYKICPFCANEIKEGAIKCQYCKEFLDEENLLCITKTVSAGEKTNGMENIVDKNKSKSKLVLKKILEVIFIIFGLNDQRITASRGFLLYFLGSLLSFGIVGLIVLPFGINIIDSMETGDNARCGEIAAILFLVFLWGYILPKRAHDHGRPGFMGLIPIVNIYYFWARGDQGSNKYGEKPSLINDLRRCFYKNTFILQPSKSGKFDLKNVHIAEKK